MYVDRADLCDLHARQRFRNGFASDESTSALRFRRQIEAPNGAEFDIDFLWWDELRPEPPWGTCFVSLKEIGGRRNFGFEIGLFEWCSLDIAINRLELPRPFTHLAMSTMISALGASLRYVEIDMYRPLQSIMEAKLRVVRGTEQIGIDCRPSDALIVAATCGAPIIASNQFLDAFPGVTSP